MKSLAHVPQASGAWPLVGHAPSLTVRPLAFFRGLSQYGPLVGIKLGRLPAYVSTDPELVHQLLVTDARDYSRGYAHDKARVFLGEGLVTSSGALHRRHRRMIQPEFHRTRVAELAETMTAAVVDMTAEWEPGRTLEMDQEMAELALTTVTRSLFAKLPPESARRTQRSVPILMKGIIWRGVTPEWVGKLPLPVNHRFRRATADIFSVVSEVMSTYRASQHVRQDLLSTLMEVRDEQGRALTDEEIYDQVVTFFMAGVETSSAALAWSLHELGRNPEVERRLHAELDSVVKGGTPSYADLPHLPYLGRVITEVLRMYPIWFQMRRTRIPVRLGAFDLPGGTELLYSPHLLHHDPRWFAEADRFDPDRWLPERARAIPRHAFIPFGSGTHKCVGDNFALTQITLDLATICSRWRLVPLPGTEVRKVIHATVHPHRLPMTPERRNT